MVTYLLTSKHYTVIRRSKGFYKSENRLRKVTCPRMQVGQDSFRSVGLDSMLLTIMLHQEELRLGEENQTYQL